MKIYKSLSIKARAAFCLVMSLILVKAASVPVAVMAQAEGTPLPIIMYHSVLKDPKRSGSYIVSPQTVENDLAFLKQHGYTAVLPCELYEMMTKGESLPEKPIMITFDDGFLNNLTYVLPLLEKYDMKAVVSVVGSYCECFSKIPDPNPAYAYLSWEDIIELTETQRVEIGNHSYDMHKKEKRKGIKRMIGENEAEYYRALVCDVGATQSLLEENCGIVPTVFAYPFGSVCEEAVPILQEMGFKTLLTCSEKVNMLNGDITALLNLGRFNRPSELSTERFMKKLGIK